MRKSLEKNSNALYTYCIRITRRKVMKKLSRLLSVICVIAVCFSLSDVFVKSVNADSSSSYTKFVKTEPDLRYNLFGAPSVVLRLKNANGLDSVDLSTDERPANVIMTVNEDLDVVGADGSVIDSFYNVLDEIYLSAIPVVELKTHEAAEAFVNAYNANEISDIAVMSDDDLLLAYVRNALPHIRGIYDCSGLTTLNKAEIVKNSTMAMAIIVVLSEAQSDLETVTYFQSRMKTVWTELSDTADSFDVKNAIASGCYGLIKNDVSAIFEAYSTYNGGSLNDERNFQPSVARYSLNIAHRGLPLSMAENTVEGCKAAVAAGATHIEIDAQFSKDKQIVIMHDSDVSRTTDYLSGEKYISNMTLDEIRQYKVCKTSTGFEVDACEIPTVEDFFIAFKDSPVVFVFEIKNSNPELVTELRKLIEKYDFWDRITVISFSGTVLEKMHRDLREIPIASLSGFAPKDFENDSKFYNAYNAIGDITNGSLGNYVYYESTLKDRGYMSFCWTLGTAQDCVNASSMGKFGLTNNSADVYGDLVCRVEGKSGQVIKAADLKKGKEITVITTDYNGDISEEKGTVFAVRKFDDHAEVIAAYEEVEKVTYTRAFRVDYNGKTSGGCGSSIAANLGALLILLPAAFVVLSVKRAGKKA